MSAVVPTAVTTTPDPNSLRWRAAQERFVSDLPALLTQFPGKWVAYSTEDRLGISNSKTELYKQCRAAGLNDDDFVARLIETNSEYAELGPGVVEIE